MSYGGEMNDAGDGDDEKADDDGGDCDIEGVLAQPPRSIKVTLIVAVPGLEGRKKALLQVWTRQHVRDLTS